MEQKETVRAVAAVFLIQLPDAAERSGSLDVRLSLGGDRWLSGTVPGASGDQLRLITFSRVNARHRLAMWVRLVALTAASTESARVISIPSARFSQRTDLTQHCHQSRVPKCNIPDYFKTQVLCGKAGNV